MDEYLPFAPAEAAGGRGEVVGAAQTLMPHSVFLQAGSMNSILPPVAVFTPESKSQ